MAGEPYYYEEGYFAYSLARVSRMTQTRTWPG